MATNGEVVFAFGKHVGSLARTQKGYLQWMLDTDFGPETKAWCKRLLRA